MQVDRGEKENTAYLMLHDTLNVVVNIIYRPVFRLLGKMRIRIIEVWITEDGLYWEAR